jgi:hypothetical protein
MEELYDISPHIKEDHTTHQGYSLGSLDHFCGDSNDTNASL